MDATGGVYEQQTGTDAIGPLSAMIGGTDAKVVAVEVDATEEALSGEVELVLLAGKLISHAAIGSDARLDLIDSLRRRILSGTYRVSAMDLVDSLVGAMRSPSVGA